MYSEKYNTKELLIPDVVDNYVPVKFSENQVIKIIEILGRSPEEAINLSNTVLTIVSDRTIQENLFQAF